MILRSIFLCAAFISLCDCARILGVFPIPSISHQVVFRRIVHELAKRGHEVVTITPDPILPKNHEGSLKEIDIHDISYEFWSKKFVPKMVGLDYDPIAFLDIAYGCVNELFEVQFSQPEIQELLANRNQTFDLILVESVSRVALGVSQVFKAPVISVSSLAVLPDQPLIMGFPGHSLLNPHIYSLRTSNYTLWDKVLAIYDDLRVAMVYRSLERTENAVLRRVFGDDCPSIQELLENIHMSFINENAVFDTRPMPPSVIYIGGIHIEPVKDLPKNFKTYMDESKNGVIYMSLGTNVKPSGLHPRIKSIFIHVLSSLPYDVILKWDTDELAGKYENIFTTKWAPQNELLRHPKVKLFINQAGLQSTDEAISAGVPLLGLPVLADQFKNSEKYVQLGIGMRLSFDTLTEKDFRDAIEHVIGNRSYQENIARLGAQIQDQPQTPLERAVWWTEYVLRHNGAKQLRSPQANISWFDYLAIDAALVILALFVLGLFLLLVVLNVMFELYNFGLKGNFSQLDFMRPKKYD